MCIIIANEGDRLPDEHLENSFDANSHGAGIAWAEDGLIQSYKTMSKDDFIKKYHEIKDKGVANVLLHCRIKTHGSVGLENCHPFPVHDDKMLMHNGVIELKYWIHELGYGSMGEEEFKKLDLSDTAMFAKYLTNQFPKNFMNSPKALNIIGTLIEHTYNKVAVINSSGKIVIVNDHLGSREGNNWYSNDSYKRKKYYAKFYFCDYCDANVPVGCERVGSWDYCPKHVQMAKDHKAGFCDKCNEATDKVTSRKGIELCDKCISKEKIKVMCEGCRRWGVCSYVEGVYLCDSCIGVSDKKPLDEFNEYKKKHHGVKLHCRLCAKKDYSYIWNGIWLCTDCLRLAFTKQDWSYDMRECKICNTTMLIDHMRIKHAYICADCIDEPQSYCPECRKWTIDFDGFLCSDCGKPKLTKELYED